MILPVCRAEGFSRVLITCDDDNEASRKVILANGGEPAGTLPHMSRPGHVKCLFWVPTRMTHRTRSEMSIRIRCLSPAGATPSLSAVDPAVVAGLEARVAIQAAAIVVVEIRGDHPLRARVLCAAPADDRRPGGFGSGAGPECGSACGPRPSFRCGPPVVLGAAHVCRRRRVLCRGRCRRFAYRRPRGHVPPRSSPPPPLRPPLSSPPRPPRPPLSSLERPPPPSIIAAACRRGLRCRLRRARRHRRHRRAMAGDRMALATIAGIAAAVSEARTAPRTRTLGPFLIGFSIVFLHSSVAPRSAPMEEQLARSRPREPDRPCQRNISLGMLCWRALESFMIRRHLIVMLLPPRLGRGGELMAGHRDRQGRRQRREQRQRWRR